MGHSSRNMEDSVLEGILNYRVLAQEVLEENVVIYTKVHYSAIKNKDIMNFAGKWMELEHIILSEVTQFPENMYSMYSRISGY